MISIKLKNTVFLLPETWEELTKVQYIKIVNLLPVVLNDADMLHPFRLYVLYALLNIKISNKQYPKATREQIQSNLAIMAGLLKFPVIPEYDDNSQTLFDTLSSEACEALQNNFPDEIYSPANIHTEIQHIKSLLNFKAAVNFNMQRNPLPCFFYRGIKYTGPEFNIDTNGIATTDITTARFVEAHSYYKLYLEYDEPRYLNGMIQQLYAPVIDMPFLKKRLNKIPQAYKNGILFFFQNILEYYFVKSPYRLIFSGTADNTGKLQFGLEESILSLAKEGYAGKEEIANWNLADFFNAMLKQLKDCVEHLRSSGMKDTEIAEKTKLDIETVKIL